MPPIAGVVFGPLLLQNVMFKNMELPMMEMVLALKVTGARLLNERLSDPANSLDFFVMFSSSSSPTRSRSGSFTRSLPKPSWPAEIGRRTTRSSSLAWHT